MHKLLIAVLALLVGFGLWAVPAEAGYVAGTAAGTNIVVGGDGGSANQADAAGDVVASYTSVAGNDTAFKTNQGANATATVSSIFGDTAAAVGPGTVNIAPGGSNNFTLSITNFANKSDTIRIKTDTPSVTGAAANAVTIRVNGSIIYQNGADTFAPVNIVLPSGAETQVIVQMSHDIAGALGNADAVIKTLPNNGGGGDTNGYTGNNGDSYAGIGNANVTFGVFVKEVNVRMLVEHDPILTPAGYNGPLNDTVPGSTLTYVIRYDNDGNDTAVGFTINAKIPVGTVIKSPLNDTVNLTPHSGATATVVATNDSGAVVADTDPSATRIKWTFNIGVAPTNGDGTTTVDASINDADAGYVKFKVYIK